MSEELVWTKESLEEALGRATSPRARGWIVCELCALGAEVEFSEIASALGVGFDSGMPLDSGVLARALRGMALSERELETLEEIVSERREYGRFALTNVAIVLAERGRRELLRETLAGAHIGGVDRVAHEDLAMSVEEVSGLLEELGFGDGAVLVRWGRSPREELGGEGVEVLPGVLACLFERVGLGNLDVGDWRDPDAMSWRTGLGLAQIPVVFDEIDALLDGGEGKDAPEVIASWERAQREVVEAFPLPDEEYEELCAWVRMAEQRAATGRDDWRAELLEFACVVRMWLEGRREWVKVLEEGEAVRWFELAAATPPGLAPSLDAAFSRALRAVPDDEFAATMAAMAEVEHGALDHHDPIVSDERTSFGVRAKELFARAVPELHAAYAVAASQRFDEPFDEHVEPLAALPTSELDALLDQDVHPYAQATIAQALVSQGTHEATQRIAARVGETLDDLAVEFIAMSSSKMPRPGLLDALLEHRIPHLGSMERALRFLGELSGRLDEVLGELEKDGPRPSGLDVSMRCTSCGRHSLQFVEVLWLYYHEDGTAVDPEGDIGGMDDITPLSVCPHCGGTELEYASDLAQRKLMSILFRLDLLGQTETSPASLSESGLLREREEFGAHIQRAYLKREEGGSMYPLREALAERRAYAERHEDDAAAHERYGVTLAQGMMDEEALAPLERALELDPRRILARFELIGVRRRQGGPAEQWLELAFSALEHSASIASLPDVTDRTYDAVYACLLDLCQHILAVDFPEHAVSFRVVDLGPGVDSGRQAVRMRDVSSWQVFTQFMLSGLIADVRHEGTSRGTTSFARRMFSEEVGRTGADLGAAYEGATVLQSGSGETFERSGEKVGRNDPCPCGSGKKYKKCCMKKDR